MIKNDSNSTLNFSILGHGAKVANQCIWGKASLFLGTYVGDSAGSILQTGQDPHFIVTKADTAVQGVMGTILGGCKGSAVANILGGFGATYNGNEMRLGTHASVNTNGVDYKFWGLSAHNGRTLTNMRYQSFYYDGNGLARTLTGLGIDLTTKSKVVVVIKGAGAHPAIFRTSNHADYYSSYFLAATADLTTGISGFTSDGISISTGTTISSAGVRYYGFVMCEDTEPSAELIVGSYIGDVSKLQIPVPLEKTSMSLDQMFIIPNGANPCMFLTYGLAYVSASTTEPDQWIELDWMNNSLLIPESTLINDVNNKVNFAAILNPSTYSNPKILS